MNAKCAMVTWQDLIEFLRCISKIHLGETDKEFVFQFCQKDVPWEGMGALAEMEGVSGFLYYHMKDLGLLDALPKSFAGPIENSYHRAKQHTLAIAAEARALSAMLEEAGVPVVALQGLSLLSVYGEPGLRTLGDADLMVKPGHKERLKGLMRGAGFRAPTIMYPDLLYKDGIWFDIHAHILNLDRIQHRSYVFPENLTSMWERAIPLFDQPNGLLVLDPFDNFISLSAHALKHSYSRLIWLSDLHESLLLWATTRNGWERMVDRARFWKQEKVILYALILMERVFNLKVAWRVKRELGMQQLNIVEKHLLRLKLRGLSSNELCIPLWLSNIRGIGRKLRFMRETVFPQGEIMAQIFPEKSQGKKRIIYVQRIANAIILLGKNLHQALTFSLSAKGYG